VDFLPADFLAHIHAFLSSLRSFFILINSVLRQKNCYLTGIHEVGDEPVIAEDDCLQSLEVLAAGQVLHRHLVLHQAAQEVPGPGRLTLTPYRYIIFQILGLVILNYGSGSRMLINYGSKYLV
jgi:hypothetical protein